MEALNANEQRELQTRMERKQIKEFMTVYFLRRGSTIDDHCTRTLALTLSPYQMYSRLVQNCFDSCINDFTSKALASREENCVMRCVDKHQKAGERVNLRFQEQNVAMMQSGQVPGR
ncbi:MAG: hypothetical protein Q9223_007215 [Gallowayella weberi]